MAEEKAYAYNKDVSSEYETTADKKVPQSGYNNYEEMVALAGNPSKGRVGKQFREQEFNTLNGSLSLMPGYDSHNLNVGDVISLYNITQALNGNYYITDIRRSISQSGGYSIELSVTKTTFMEQMNTPTNEQTTTRPKPVEIVDKNTGKSTDIISKGGKKK